MFRHAQITDADAYLEDDSLFGVVASFQIPGLETATVDHETLGSIAVFQAPARPLQAMEAEIEFQAIDADLSRRLLNPTKPLAFQLHSKVDVWGPDGLDADRSHRLITHVRLLFRGHEYGAATLGELAGHTATASCIYLRQRASNQNTSIVEIDVFNQRYKVDGEDVWPRGR